ncbi:MAG: VPDSG-CTERM sorting domain-containing protein [Chthoniobacterales bacterium]
MSTTLLGLSPLLPVPESGATFALLAFALVSLILVHRRLSRTRAQTAANQNAKRTMLIIAAMFVFAASAVAGPAAPPVSVPESGQTVILLGVALIALIAWRHRAAKKI